MKKYIGRCIYCPDDVVISASELTDEHIVPAGLMGSYVLEKASCKAHAVVTSRFERKVLRGMFGPVREWYAYQSGRRKERPPLEQRFETNDGMTVMEMLSAWEHPYHLVMPILPPPGILVGRKRNLGFPPKVQSAIHTHDAGMSRMRALLEKDPSRRNFITPVDAGSLTKLLAKIAYGFALYYNAPPFHAQVLKLILAPKDDAVLGPYFVGAPFIQDGVPQTEVPQNREFGAIVRVERIGKKRYVIARIHLFISKGMPAYDVVIGRTKSLPH